MSPVQSLHAEQAMFMQPVADTRRGSPASCRQLPSGSDRRRRPSNSCHIACLPILASMREAFLSGPFKPGTMERRFGPMLDVHTAEAITSSSRFGLVDSVVDQLVGSSSGSRLEVTA